MTEPRLFSAMEWIAAGIAFGVALAVFVGTLAPTVTMEYSGALVVAADHLGVARPPGYPIWTLLAKGFIEMFSGAAYQGHPNPAWAVNLMSAVFGALACGLLALIVSRESRRLFADSRPVPEAFCAVAGIAAGLLFAFSPALWSQAVIAETHALTNFHFLLLLALTLRWIAAGERRDPFLLAFLAGLGLSVSPLLILFLPVLWCAGALVSRQTLFRVAAAGVLFLGFIAVEFRFGIASPRAAALVLGAVLAIALLLASFRLTRSTALLLVLLLAGLIPYVYLPLASDHNPPMNMGYARTWEGFWHVIRRGQYEALVLSNPFADPLKFARQLAWLARLAAAQFTAPIAALAFVPLFGWPWLSRAARRSVALVAVALICFGLVALIGTNPQLDVQNTFIARVIFIPAFALLALLAGIGLATIFRAGSYFRTRTRKNPLESGA